jgi:F-type H+-transporting ATPase subunit b
MHPDWWTIGLQTINFAILVWLLHRFLYKPVLAMIEARKAAIRREYQAAESVEHKSKAQLDAVEAQRMGIAQEREAAVKAAASEALQLAEARRVQAERDAQALMDSARKALASERERALDEARWLALDLGAAFAQKLLAEIPMEYRAKAWIDRIEQHLNSLAQAERDALVGQLANGELLTVTTASPLPDSTADQWKDRLRRSLGIDGGVQFQVDPKLIAGAELHFPTAILHFSWQSTIAAARTEISQNAKSG